MAILSKFGLKSFASVSILALMMTGVFVVFPETVEADRTVFFEDFSESSLSSKWAYKYLFNSEEVFLGGSILTLTVTKTRMTGGGNTTGIIASSTDPLIFSGMPKTFFNLAVNAQPFNLTERGLSVTAFAEMYFGLANFMGIRGPGTAHFSFALQQTGQQAVLTPKQDVWLQLRQIGATNCFDITTGNPPCSTLHYNNVNVPIDLSSSHVFQMQVMADLAGESWVAFSVDSNAIVNMTQSACLCVEPSSDWSNMYPFIMIFYQATSGSSLFETYGGLVNYIQITDFVPETLPPGVIFPTQQPSNPSAVPKGSPAWYKSMAANLGNGNLYLGGFWLTLISLMGIIIPVGWKFPNAFLVQFIAIMIVGAMTFLGLLPLWVVFIEVVLILALGLQIIKTEGPTTTKAGIVPD